MKTRPSAACAALLGLLDPVLAAEPDDPELDALIEPLRLAPAMPAEDATFREALTGGHAWVKLRYRYEYVDDDAFSRHANASTLRTVLGYETGEYEGFVGVLEFEDVAPVGSDSYDSTVNGETSRPLVPDPDGGEVNQSYLRYTGFEDVQVAAGRQRITLGNLRFIGNVGWRQNEQTFDALSVSCDRFGGWNLFYAYLSNVNRVFGDDSPANTPSGSPNLFAGDQRMQSHLLHASRGIGSVGDLYTYAYLLDYDSADAFSTNTFGANLAGSARVASLDLEWAAEFATQSDTGDNPNDVDANYYRGELGPRYGRYDCKVLYEVLEGSGDSGDRFITPLATLHAWNGFADKFVNTPDGGLEDLAFSVGADLEGTKLRGTWHEYQANDGGDDYGSELDLSAIRAVGDDLSIGLKYANFSSDDSAFSDAEKFWVWLAYSF